MEYDIKRGNYGNLEGDGLRKMMESAFGSAKMEGDACVSTYGAMTRIEVKLKSKTLLDINTVTNKEAPVDIATETIKMWNSFLEQVTGFTSKERRTRLQKKAKEGKL